LLIPQAFAKDTWSHLGFLCAAFPSVSTYLPLPFLTCLQLESCGDFGFGFSVVVVVDNGE
jgi:hypothetical protein